MSAAPRGARRMAPAPGDAAARGENARDGAPSFGAAAQWRAGALGERAARVGWRRPAAGADTEERARRSSVQRAPRLRRRESRSSPRSARVERLGPQKRASSERSAVAGARGWLIPAGQRHGDSLGAGEPYTPAPQPLRRGARRGRRARACSAAERHVGLRGRTSAQRSAPGSCLGRVGRRSRGRRRATRAPAGPGLSGGGWTRPRRGVGASTRAAPGDLPCPQPAKPAWGAPGALRRAVRRRAAWGATLPFHARGASRRARHTADFRRELARPGRPRSTISCRDSPLFARIAAAGGRLRRHHRAFRRSRSKRLGDRER